MQIRLAETHALIGLVGSDDFLNTMNQQPVAHWSALMRANVEERVKLAFRANNADLSPLAVHHIAGALRHILRPRNENLSHRQSFNLCSPEHLRGGPDDTIEDFHAQHEQN
jgi:hypothetical protein